MGIIEQIILFIFIVNLVGAIITVFRKPRNITTIWAWLLTLIFLPVIGFLIYAFCGRGIDGETMYLFEQDDEARVKEINEIIQQDNRHVDYNEPDQLINRDIFLNSTITGQCQHFLRQVQSCYLKTIFSKFYR